MNLVILIGHAGREPELKRFDSGSLVAKVSIATNEGYKDSNGEWQDATEWHDVIAWNNLAEKLDSTISKGDEVMVRGKLTTREWTDKEGKKRYIKEVKANLIKKITKHTTSSLDGFIDSDK